MAAKIYAVKKGHKTGIFNSWEECKSAVEGFPGAEYKSFSKLEDAEIYLKNEDVGNVNINKAILDAINNNTVISYVDGSYDNKVNKYAFGCVIVTPNQEIIKENGCGDDPDAIAISNIAGELQGALFAAKWAFRNGYNKIEIRHDYEGIAKWFNGEWKAKNKVVKTYIEEMEKLKPNINIIFTKVDAHTNDPLNDEADKLAKEALVSGREAKVKKGDSWFTAEGITDEELHTIIQLVKEEHNSIIIAEGEIPHGKRFELTLPPKDRVVVQYYGDKKNISIQGKPQRLFSVIVTYITELVDIENIPEFFNGFFKLNINKENVSSEFKTYFPHANGRLPEKIDKVLHQAVYNLNIVGDVFDATFLVEPALRALEGHIKYVLLINGISLKEKPEDKQDKFYMFDKIGLTYQLKHDIGEALDKDLRVYIGKCYTFYCYKRHQLCHWDDPTAAVDTTKLIKTTNEAHQLIKETFSLIDEYYKMTK